MFAWPFSKTYKLRCKDGSVRIVHRNVDDAFPFYLPGWKANLNSSIKIPATGQGGINSAYETKIHGLLFGLDELNQSLMMNFRGAYISYQADPCTGHEFLLREVSKVLHEQHRLLAIRLQIEGLISLAQICQNNSDFVPLYREILTQIGGPTVPDAAILEIKESIQQMRKWIGAGDAS